MARAVQSVKPGITAKKTLYFDDEIATFADEVRDDLPVDGLIDHLLAENHLIMIRYVHQPEHPLVTGAPEAASWYLTDGDRDDETMG